MAAIPKIYVGLFGNRHLAKNFFQFAFVLIPEAPFLSMVSLPQRVLVDGIEELIESFTGLFGRIYEQI